MLSFERKNRYSKRLPAKFRNIPESLDANKKLDIQKEGMSIRNIHKIHLSGHYPYKNPLQTFNKSTINLSIDI